MTPRRRRHARLGPAESAFLLLGSVEVLRAAPVYGARPEPNFPVFPSADGYLMFNQDNAGMD